jgi:phage terminase small subunit
MIRPHPLVAMLADADRRYRGWESEFGLTPASRPRVPGVPAAATGTRQRATSDRVRPDLPATLSRDDLIKTLVFGRPKDK